MPYLEKIDDNDLAHEQRLVYNYSLDKNLLIKGAAGSGKTILALLRAKQLEDNGKSVLFIVFNNVLRSFTDMAASMHGLKKTRICQLQDLTYETLGYRVYDPSTLSEKEIKLLNSKYNFDHVIIDEGQDFSMELYENIFRKIGSVFTICCDQRQSIYDANFDESVLPVIFSGIEERNLEFTYRNPREIMELTYNYYHQILQTKAHWTTIKCYNAQSGKVIRFSTNDEIEMIKRIIDNRGINTVGIFLPRSEIVTLFESRLKARGIKDIETYYNGKQKNHPSFQNESPKIMPYWSTKGTQFDTVILPFLDHTYEDHAEKNIFNKNWEREWKALYVAMTRARKNLYLIRTKNYLFPYEMYLDDQWIEDRGKTHNGKEDIEIIYKNKPPKPPDDLPF